jgi:hypothetical protein
VQLSVLVHRVRFCVGIAWGSKFTRGGMMRKAIWFSAIVFATLQYAMNTVDVNGQSGKGNFKPLPDDFLAPVDEDHTPAAE